MNYKKIIVLLLIIIVMVIIIPEGISYFITSDNKIIRNTTIMMIGLVPAIWFLYIKYIYRK